MPTSPKIHAYTHSWNGSDPMTGLLERASMFRSTDKTVLNSTSWALDDFDVVRGGGGDIDPDDTTGVITLARGVYLAQVSAGTSGTPSPIALRLNVVVTPDEEPDFVFAGDTGNGYLTALALIDNDTDGGTVSATFFNNSGGSVTVGACKLIVVRQTDF